MPFGRWFYNTEQLVSLKRISGNFYILLLIRDFTKKRIRNIQLFSNL